ncbi:MAG: Dabb family protein [bacterium]|nr:Dabb family protein [bacterium]
MIRHIVLMKCKADASQEQLNEMFAALKGLTDSIPGILAFEGGADNSPEQIARGYTHAFSMDFADEETRERYLPHPAHKKAQEKMRVVLDDCDDCALVLDFSIEPNENCELYQTS